MAERRLVILMYSGKTPSLAMCDACHLKFFAPRDLMNKPVDAEMYLREKFTWHECHYTHSYDINLQNLFRLQRFFMASMRRPRLVGLSQA
jgi:hypothetical protein